MSLIHRRMAIRSWEQGIFPRLSPLRPSGQALALVLSLSPLSIIVPGVANAGRGAVLDVLPSWSGEDLDDCLVNLQEHGALVDLSARVIFLPWVLDEATPESPNVVKAWRRRFDELPACDVKTDIDQHVRQFLIAYGQAGKSKKDTRPLSWIEAWDPTFTEGSDEPSATLPETFTEGSDHPSAKHRRSVVAPFPESGNRDQGIREQGSGDRDQASGSRSQAAGSRKGKSTEKGEPRKRQAAAAPAACWCGQMVIRLPDGRTVNADDGSTQHDVAACAARERAGVQ